MDERTPSLAEAPSLPVTTGTILVCLALFALVDSTAADAVILDVRAFESQPWRLLTSCLLHGNLFHLGFNLFWMWRIGALIEHQLGHGRLAILMVLFGAVSGAAEYALGSVGGIGLSGVIYGLFAFTWVLDTIVPSFRGVLDRYTIGVFIAWFFLAVILTELGLINIANVAHGVGALCGALMGWAMALLDWRRWVAATGMMLLTVGALAGATVGRPLVNLSRYPGIDSALLGEAAYQDGNYVLAEKRYRQATHYRSVHEDWWFNLGLSIERQGRVKDALKAYERALALDPDHEKANAALLRLAGAGDAGVETPDETGAPPPSTAIDHGPPIDPAE